MTEISTSRRTAATRVAALAVTFALGAGIGPSQAEFDETTAELAASSQQATSVQAELDAALAAKAEAEAQAAEAEKAAEKAKEDLVASQARAKTYREERDEARSALEAGVVAAAAAPAPQAATAPSQARSGSAPATPATKTSAVRVVDGDTVEIDGVKIRVGLVNTPEKGEGCFDEATRFTTDFLGGRASYNGYATDNYGRTVAEVFNASGQSLNVAIAASRLSDDRYYDTFAHENPDLARRVRAAYEAPRSDCFGGQAAPAQSNSNCHPDYITCIPIKGDGSGNGNANDLDCGDIRKKVQLRKVGRDPYRLDGSDQDGWGCESYG